MTTQAPSGRSGAGFGGWRARQLQGLKKHRPSPHSPGCRTGCDHRRNAGCAWRSRDVVFVGDHDDGDAMVAVQPVMRSMISRLVFVSRLPVGSSARRTAGLVTMARAIATRCCWPPDSSWVWFLSRPTGRPGKAPSAPAHVAHAHPCRDRRAAVRRFDRRCPGEQVEALKDEAQHVATQQRVLRPVEARGVDPLKKILARGRHVEAAEDVHGGRFAGTGRPHDGDEFVPVDRQVDAIQRADRRFAASVDAGIWRNSMRVPWPSHRSAVADGLVGDHAVTLLHVPLDHHGVLSVGRADLDVDRDRLAVAQKPDCALAACRFRGACGRLTGRPEKTEDATAAAFRLGGGDWRRVAQGRVGMSRAPETFSTTISAVAVMPCRNSRSSLATERIPL